MYQNVSENYGDAIAGPNRTFNLKLTENDIDIVDSLKSVQITAGSEEITICSAVSTYFDATIEKQDITLSGKEVTLQAGIEINGQVEYIPMGVYTIQNPRTQGNTISFTAYDRLASRCNGGYFSKIAYPADALDVLSEIESMTGITVDKTGLARGIQIQKRAVINEDTDGEEDTVSTTYVNPFDGYTYKETIGFIAGLFGKFAVCGRTGNVEFKWYTETGYTITADTFYDDFEESEDGFVLGRLECDTADETLISGTGATGVSFTNPVMTQGNLDSIFSFVKDLAFTPGMVRFTGDLRVDLGDIITIIKNDGSEFKVPVIHLLTSYDGGLMQSITSAGNTEAEDDADSKGPITETVERVSYELAFIKTLMVDNFTATNGTVKNLSGDFLNFKTGEFETLKAQQANFENATAENFTAVRVEIENLVVGNLDAKYATIDFANIDTAKIRQGFMENLMVSQGIFTSDITAAEGTFTNYLTGVNILANNITAGTLSVERLIITGSDHSIVYEINKANGTPQLSQTTVDGGSLTERTVTADRIVAGAITANEIDVTNLFAQDITATGTITGVNLLGATGSFSGNIVAATGTIGPWTLNNSSIYKGNSGFGNASGMYFGNNGFSITDKFKVTNAGVLTAASGSFSGTINATSGTFKNGIFRDCTFQYGDGSYGIWITGNGNDSYFYANGAEARVFIAGDEGVAVQSKGGYLYSAIRDIGVYGQMFCARASDDSWVAITGISSSKNIWLGTSDAKNALSDTNIYAQSNLNLYANRKSASYKSTAINFFREQSDSHRTVFRGSTNGAIYLGTTTFRFNTAFFSNAITASDLKEKEVLPVDKNKYIDLIMKLRPLSYHRIGEGDTGKRTHMGLGAQDVADAIKIIGMGDMSLVQAAKITNGEETPYCGEDVSDDELSWGLNYTELFAPLIHTVQATRREMDHHAGRIDKQEAIINDLQIRLGQAEKEIKELKQATQ